MRAKPNEGEGGLNMVWKVPGPEQIARSDRFCEGHFGEMIENGEMLAIVRRLAEIHRSRERGEK